MKRILVIGLVIATLSLLGGFAIPVFAHGPDDGQATPPSSETWDAMHEACETGDWEAMAEAAEESHEEFGYTACHGDYTPEEDTGSTSRWGGMMGRGWGNHMGGGMIGW